MSRKEWIVVGLLVFSVLVNYVDRGNLSLAMPLLQREFAFSPLRAAELLSAFFWTYALVQLLGIAGWLTDRYSAGWVLMGGYLLWSLAMACLGFAPSYVALFALQLVLGMGESVAYPCYSRIFAAMPQEHRGRANAFIDAGTKIGPAAGAFVGGMILVHNGWRLLFLAFGIGALVWLVPWYLAMPRDRQTESPGAVDHAQQSANPAAEPSILKMLRLRCAWGALIGHFCGNYFYYLVLAWLPTYLVQEEHLSIRAMSRLTAAVFLLIACSTVTAGWISDRLIARGASPTAVRLHSARAHRGSRSSIRRSEPARHRLHRPWRLRVKPLGNRANPCRTENGRPLVEPAKRLCQFLRDHRTVAHGIHCADAPQRPPCLRHHRCRGASWRRLLDFPGAPRGTCAVGCSAPRLSACLRNPGILIAPRRVLPACGGT
jgi:MFS family permease